MKYAKSEYWPIGKLKLWERNPRSIKGDRFNELKARLKRQGQIKPILVTEDGTVIGGNMRLRAMTELGISEAWVSVTDAKTDKDIFDLALTDNEEFGYYEQEQVAELALELGLTTLELKNYALSLGEPTTLDLVIDKFAPTPEEDEAPEVDDEHEPESVLGEVYQLGRHRLMCGSATELADVEKLMDGKKADMVFTDPPYNVAGESRNFAADVSKSMNDLANSDWDIDFDSTKVVPMLQEHVSDDSTTYIFTSHFLFGELYEQYKAWADFTSYCVWSKPNPMPSLSKRHWTWNTELCLYATKGKHISNFGEGHELSCWQVNKKSDGTHPTQKPIEICARAIKFSSKSGNSVLDLFGGSGSTLIACEQTDRTCYMMELDPKYVDVIRKRYWTLVNGDVEGWQDGTRSA
jgi:DNA modification methylase